MALQEGAQNNFNTEAKGNMSVSNYYMEWQLENVYTRAIRVYTLAITVYTAQCLQLCNHSDIHSNHKWY